MLPLFIPVMVRTFGSANWWPNMARGVGENVPTSNEQSKSL
jgi:RND superfamily putative drug exporter